MISFHSGRPHRPMPQSSKPAGAARAVLAQPPYEGKAAQAQGRAGDGAAEPLLAAGLRRTDAAPADAFPQHWGEWAGAWLGMAWATFRSGLLRLGAAMGPNPPAEGAPGAAAMAGLELVGGVSQVLMTPVVVGVAIASQVGGSLLNAATAVADAGQSFMKALGLGWQSFWDAFHRQAGRDG